jgi:hypothetical protein
MAQKTQARSAANRSSGPVPSRKRSAPNRRSRSPAKPRTQSSTKSSPGSVASKLKTPAIAAGTAVVGMAGGLALAGRGSRKKVLGVPVPGASTAETTSKSLAEAAKQLGSFAERAGELATEIRLVREGVANTPRRSPVEVVLQGLTSRGVK